MNSFHYKAVLHFPTLSLIFFNKSSNVLKYMKQSDASVLVGKESCRSI